jgi:hypothetical protein
MADKFKIILNNFGLDHIKPKEFKLSGAADAISSAEKKYIIPPPIAGASASTVSPIGLSSLGTPVFSRLLFLPGTYNISKLGKKIPVSYPGLTLDTVLMTVSMSKNINTQSVLGRSGTVKEYISDGDFKINIKGTLTGDNSNNYPLDKVSILRSICAAPEPIKVASDFLGLFLITNLVIESYSLSQSEGYRNIQMFDLNCVSDFPRELGINTFI